MQINFVIITNSTDNAERLQRLVGNVSVIIIDQAVVTPFNQFDLRSAYIFDNCGRLVYIIYHPWSSVQRPYVKASILSTFFDAPCGECAEDVSSCLFYLFSYLDLIYFWLALHFIA